MTLSETGTARIIVDGGGTGTRLLYHATNGVTIEVTGEASALSLGVISAWQVIEALACRAATEAGESLDWTRCALAAGLAGMNHVEWRDAFASQAPACRMLVLESDAVTSLWGAHPERAGVMLALGTGSIGAMRDEGGNHRLLGGYGFPAGDEASGAWLGLHVLPHLQKGLDGRGPADALCQALADALDVATPEALVSRFAGASARDYGLLAPVVLRQAGHPVAAALLARAGQEMALMIDALDPEGSYPVALTGSLGPLLAPWLPDRLARRYVPATGSALDGGACLLQRALTAGRALS
ncbi:BadF/BadG/BcrA/BcrD ATPase family protein [Larsenimonas rhizosphaerae]|uniref:ATPase BadF/BadG/BcrA/BcrD type domain-containing protein n=1 Tax=Larsenimonas rhizosphaerae TaxID=2944682 RepID=A0AA41ZMF6_9GAMM|nr:BadF/BadG/BcrA/BcrD ATPase family protein [Larsenimonas rhizosphaerae]MCM2130871.1 hypothetical protein [Larsenimonas rhizosphaerae]MCX2523575.1 hypothetical protein [Larsenimonas rhizosphaerae]